jgi:DNA polymerase III delta subunit
VAHLNITRLDGRQASLAEIHTSAITKPFLAERRLIILTHPLARYQSQKSSARFQDLLTALPSTTALVRVVEDPCKRSPNKQGQWVTVWKVLNENHWLLDFASKADKRVLVKAFARPQKGAVVAWIQSQADAQGGEIDNNAAQLLAGFLSNDTHLLNQKIIKLLQYVDY